MNQQSIVYHFNCDLCDVDYVGYTFRHLYQRIEEHKGSAIGKQVRDQYGRDPSDISLRFKVTQKCQSKFDCLIYYMLFVKELKPTLNMQTDSIRAKLLYSAEYFICSFVKIFALLLSSVLYFSFYHLSLVTLSTYFHIFIAFHILTCDFTSYMQSSIHFFKT